MRNSIELKYGLNAHLYHFISIHNGLLVWNVANDSLPCRLTGSMIIFLVGSIFWALTVVHEMTVLIPFLMGLIFASVRILQSQEENHPRRT